MSERGVGASDGSGGAEVAGAAGGGAVRRASRGSSEAKSLWRRLELTERDLEVLSWAHEQKFLLFGQASRWFPEGRSLPPEEAPSTSTRPPGSWYFQRRARKLLHFGLLAKQPVYGGERDALLLGREGHAALIAHGRDGGLGRLTSIDWKSFDHDRQVTDLRWHFEKELGGTWDSERKLRRESPSKASPDALIRLRGQAYALELELTRKGLQRYCEIFRRYLIGGEPRAYRVLYVLPNEAALEHQFRSVLPAVLQWNELWGIRQPDVSMLRFTTMQGLRRGEIHWTVASPSSPLQGAL